MKKEVFELGLALTVLVMMFYFGCAAATQAKPVIDLTALELACVNSASTPVAATDCRNAVRQAWARANAIPVTDLEGGSHAADH